MQDVVAEALPLPPAPVALMVQVSPAGPTGSPVDPEHAMDPLLGVVPVQAYVHDVALVQFHVTVAGLPHAGREPNDNVQFGTGNVQPVLAVALPVPPGPVALRLQLSPAAPTATLVDPEHATGPPLVAVPVQAYVHVVASVQLHVSGVVPPQVGAPPKAAEQCGADTHPTVAVAESLVPPGPVALMVQVSPAGPTVTGDEPLQATAPPEDVVPVQVYVHDDAPVHAQVTVAAPPHVGALPNEAVQCGRSTHVVLAVALPTPPGPVPVIVQFSPADATVIELVPVHANAPLLGVVPVHAYVQDVAPVQFHVTVALAPHAVGADHAKVHPGGAMQVVLAIADPVPPGPVALTVQVSPVPPTVTGAEPAQATAPAPVVLPAQEYLHHVASAQLHVTVALAPHAAGADHEAVHRGAIAGVLQCPALHVCPVAQTVPHPPQLAPSAVVSTHRPAQKVWPDGHVHPPTTHRWPAPQTVPQTPQLLASTKVSVHSPPQSVIPAGH